MSLPPLLPAYRRETHRLTDPSEFGLAVSGANLAADFLAPQSSPAIIEKYQSPHWALDFHTAQVKARIRGPLEHGWASMGLMRGKTESAFHGFAADPGVVVCNPPGEGIEGRIAPGFECTAVNIPVAVWERCRALAGVKRSDFGSVTAHRLPPAIYVEIESRLRSVHDRLSTANTPESMAFAAREAAEFTIQLATTAWQFSVPESPKRESLRNRTRLARRAETWMRAHLAEAVQVTDACLALRVSRRELEYAFRWTFDTSPRDFLQALRLNAIRRALQHGGGESETVSRLALDHGITHFGRFAQHYRALFGESPSETRRLVRYSSREDQRRGGPH